MIFKAEGVKPWEGQRSRAIFRACDCVSPCWIPLFVEMSRWSWWCCYSGSGKSTTVSCWCLSTAPQHHYSTDYNPAEKYTHSIYVHTYVKLYFFICLHPGEVRENKRWTFPLTARKKNLQSAEQTVSKTKVMRDSSLLSLSVVMDWGSLWKKVRSEFPTRR